MPETNKPIPMPHYRRVKRIPAKAAEMLFRYWLLTDYANSLTLLARVMRKGGRLAKEDKAKIMAARAEAAELNDPLHDLLYPGWRSTADKRRAVRVANRKRGTQ